jgi:hypothetical protein
VANAKFVIDGTEYEVPEDLTVGDLMWQYRYASHFGIAGDDPPSVVQMLGAMHVAILRSRPSTPPGEIEAKLLAIPLADLQGILAQIEEAVTGDPPPSETDDAPEQPSESSADGLDADPESSAPSSTGSPSSVNGSASDLATLPV